MADEPWRPRCITSVHVAARVARPGLRGVRRWRIKAPMSADITFAAALFAGLLSFLSPCVLPLVPPYLVYLAGASLERLADAEPEPAVKRDTVFAGLLFVAGFSTVFVAFGASASAIGAVIQMWSRELSIIAGIAIIVM